MADLITIPDVEIGSVGMKWPASNGEFTVTAQHLQDVMTAANDDPHIITPRLKLGHEGWPEMEGLDLSPFGTSAEPALGRVTNFRLTNDGATLIGDYVDVPAWIPAAYPNRSGEWVGSVRPTIQEGVTTPGGKHYSIVLTAVALLGVCAPAIADLEDLESFLTTGTTKAGATVVATTGGTALPATGTRADIDTVQRSFWSDFADGDRFWWWPRDIYTDPNEVLADDDEGHLFRVPFTSADDGEVTWGEPVRVRLDLVDLPPLEDAAAAVAASHRAVLATTAGHHRSFATAQAARPADRRTQRAAEQVAAASNTAASERPDSEEENPMDANVLKALARQHGLDPETATEDEVNAAIIAAENAEVDETETDETTDEVEETPEAEVEETELEPIAAKAALLERKVAELEADKKQRDQAAATAEIDARVAKVTAAAKAGLIKPHEVDTWTDRVKDPDKGEAFATVLADLEPRFGTSELGGFGDDDVLATATCSDPLPDNVSLLTPTERATRAA